MDWLLFHCKHPERVSGACMMVLLVVCCRVAVHIYNGSLTAYTSAKPELKATLKTNGTYRENNSCKFTFRVLARNGSHATVSGYGASHSVMSDGYLIVTCNQWCSGAQ